MSGHGVNDQDLPHLAYLARRLREETHGCSEWQEAGVRPAVIEMRGWNLATALEQVLRRGTDPEARTPKAMLHAMASAQLPSEKSKNAGPPRQAEECPRHIGQPRPPFCASCKVERYGVDEVPVADTVKPALGPTLAQRLAAITNPKESA